VEADQERRAEEDTQITMQETLLRKHCEKLLPSDRRRALVIKKLLESTTLDIIIELIRSGIQDTKLTGEVAMRERVDNDTLIRITVLPNIDVDQWRNYWIKKGGYCAYILDTVQKERNYSGSPS